MCVTVSINPSIAPQSSRIDLTALIPRFIISKDQGAHGPIAHPGCARAKHLPDGLARHVGPKVNRCNHKHGFQDSSALPICSNTFPYFAVPVEGLPTGLLSQPQKAISEIWLQDISVCLEYSSAWYCEGAAN